jgi:hypothetical protein
MAVNHLTLLSLLCRQCRNLLFILFVVRDAESGYDLFDEMVCLILEKLRYIDGTGKISAHGVCQYVQ